MPPEQPGTEIAGYRIESLIGRGGMAVVYRAEDLRLGRKVALKLLTPQLVDNEQFRQRFIKESRLAASLDHPNIVPIYEAGEAEGQLFIAMRYVLGPDLKGLLVNEGGHLPADRTLRLFRQIGDALDSAHRAGLVHRDVKPGNILVAGGREQTHHASGDHVYLTDFGLTKRTSELSGGLTGTGHFLGTVDYVAPEQIQGRPVGPGTDMYALGCVLYECLTGQLPFRRDDDAALLWAHLVEAPPPVTGIRPDLPAAVNPVIARAMAKDPADRYATSEELLLELELALGMPATVASPRGGTRRGGAGRHADTSDGSRTDLGTATGDVVGGSGHPSFPSTPLPLFPPPATVSRVTAPPADDEPEPEEYPDYEEDEADADWDEEEDEEPEPPARRRPWRLLALAAAAVVLVCVAAVLVRAFLLSENYRPYVSRDTVIPFRLDIPDDWTDKQSTASDLVLGPSPTVAAAVFFDPSRRPEDWNGVAGAVGSGSSDAVGLYVRARSNGFDDTSENALKDFVLQVLPAPRVGEHRDVRVAGGRADELDAVVSDPRSKDTQLRLLVDVVPSPGQGTLVLTFFAPPDTFDDHRSTFEKVRDSLEIIR
jgi:serine/threonine protein kinase